MIELGVLADDLTGGMMVASLLEREGVECPLVSSVDGLADLSPTATAVVVARKIRLIDAKDAAEEARQTVRALQGIGCSRFYYKYCATFDSTEEGNIGPVGEAMMEESGAQRALFCPAFPEYTVTIFQGRMFLGSTPLGESFKQHDPVTPMTNSNLVEVLQAQSTKKVGLLSHALLRRGRDAVNQYLAARDAPELYIADAADDDDLVRIVDVALDWPLTTGADALPVFLARGWLKTDASQSNLNPKILLPASPGKEAFIAGSCAGATLSQVDYFEQRHPVFRIDLLEAADDVDYVGKIIKWVAERIDSGPIAVASSATVDELQRTQGALGRSGAAKLADQIFGELAIGLHELGVRKFVVAGGETSGQVINSLGIRNVEVSSFDELGGGYCHQSGDDPISFVLKAGALGKEDFCFTALDRMRQAEK
ncbi:MAG: four-carbon acid sugar kinase family protein [Woeseiaceae bacterium]